MAITEQRAADVVREAVDALNAHDIDRMSATWADDMVERFPDRTCHGKAEVHRYFTDLIAAVEGLHMEIVALIGDETDVFFHWRMTGRHVGAYGGVAGTGREIAIDGMDHFTVRDGRIVSNFVVADQLQFAEQVGLLPVAGTPADRALKGAFNAKSRLVGKLRRRT